ncbi:polycystin-1-like protein 2 [Glandiceps talaboti]
MASVPHVDIRVILWAALPLLGNSDDDYYFYQITVITGVHNESATRSKIRFQVYGEDGNSEVRVLHDGQRELFLKSSINNLLMAVPKSLGELLYIRIWHDNSGTGDYRSWFLSQFEMLDLQTDKRFYFICDRWLAVDKDDGKVERLVPVAGKENLIEFSHLCMSTMRTEFSDSHVWYSILSRPSRSTFTRVQRTSCCFSLLFLTMIANAMFYMDSEEEEDARHEGGGFELGPLVITYKEIYVGFVGVLLVCPPILVIIYLFRNCEVPPTDQSLMYGFHYLKARVKRNRVLAEELDVETGVTEKRQRRKKKLAWYWSYIAWVLVFLSIVVSGIFIIMYSMQWGGDKSHRWLTSIVASILSSLVIIEPIKIIFMALMVSLIFKKPTEYKRDEVDRDSKEEIKEPKVNASVMKKQIKEDTSDSESDGDDEDEMPNEESVKKAKDTRDLELQMNRVIREIVGYFFYVFLLLAISNNNAGIDRYYLHKSLVDALEGSFYNVRESGAMFSWMNDTLLPGLYPQSYYNDKILTRNERLYMRTLSSFRIGPARLLQLRVKPDQCDVLPVMSDIMKSCNTGYSLDTMQDGTFGMRWTDGGNGTNNGYHVTSYNPWAYR